MEEPKVIDNRLVDFKDRALQEFYDYCDPGIKWLWHAMVEGYSEIIDGYKYTYRLNKKDLKELVGEDKWNSLYKDMVNKFLTSTLRTVACYALVRALKNGIRLEVRL